MIFQPEQLATNSLRRFPRGAEICQVLAAAINSADAAASIKKIVTLSGNLLIVDHNTYDLEVYKRIFVLAAGKAAVPMATAVSEILGDLISSGVVITKHGYIDPKLSILQPQIIVFEAGHPVPDRRSLKASSKLVSSIRNLDQDDLVICLFSGGGSSLMLQPATGLSLKDIQDTISLLLTCGATIDEINTIRKHLDELKGGKLAKLLFPATVITLLLSDVIGDQLDVIASGPTVADNSTFEDGLAVLKQYNLISQAPQAVFTHLSNGIARNIPETIKPGDPVLDKVQYVLVGSNTQSALAALQAAEALGFTSSLLSSPIHGEAAQVGLELAETAKSLWVSHAAGSPPACIINGGETTVTVKGTGLGGRNQELALGAVHSLAGIDQIMLISLATDGGDGPTDAAGAVVTNQTYSIGLAKNLYPLDFLERNDAYHYFEPLGDLIKTGPTLTNVNDLVFIFRVQPG